MFKYLDLSIMHKHFSRCPFVTPIDNLKLKYFFLHNFQHITVYSPSEPHDSHKPRSLTVW